MRRETVDRVAPVIYAFVNFLVIMAPAIVIKLASGRSGMSDSDGVDLLLTSAAIGLAHSVLAWARMRSEEHIAIRRADMWIAALDALVVLMVAATVLLVLVLGYFAEEHASMANRGFPVALLWGGVQFIAVVLSEVAGRCTFRWLEPPHRVRSTVSSKLTTSTRRWSITQSSRQPRN